jgi:hypothetical protein
LSEYQQGHFSEPKAEVQDGLLLQRTDGGTMRPKKGPCLASILKSYNSAGIVSSSSIPVFSSLRVQIGCVLIKVKDKKMSIHWRKCFVDIVN